MAVPAPQQQHHHRSTTKSTQKGFKSRHATKGSIKERTKGKVEAFERGSRKTPHQQVMSKLSRRNQAKQKRLTLHKEHAKANSIFASGKDGAPRIVAIVPLTQDVSSTAAVRSLNASLDIEETVPEEGFLRVNVDRFKQRILYILAKRDLLSALDACRLADYVIFVLSPEQEVDSYGELIIRSIESQGISNSLAVVQALDAIEPPKRRTQISASLKSYITHFLPTIEKVQSLDSRQESVNVVRSLCATIPKGVRWREDRSWMMVEDIRWPNAKGATVDSQETTDVVLTGVVRGQSLKADRLIQIGDWGDFQIEKITAAPLETRRKEKEADMTVDEEAEKLLDEPGEDKDDLAELAPEEVIMDDMQDYAMSIAPSERKGVLVDDHHYFSDEEEKKEETSRPKRMPKGTSKYQSAWYLGDLSDSGSDLEDVDDEMEDEVNQDASFDPADGMDDVNFDNAPEPTEAGPSEYPQSEMFLDPSPQDEEEAIAEYRRQRRTEADDDLEFPDEIELPPNALARERLARYRGLKSLKTSTWEISEDRPYEPEDWRRLLEISDYRAAKNKVLRDTLIGGVKPGTRVHVHITGVPVTYQQSHDATNPLCVFSLLRHEHKRTALNYSITLSSDCPKPLRSKEELIVQCGPRRFVVNPLFSQAGNTPNNVHKFDRFLHPGRSAIASFIGPVTWGSVPVLFFKRTSPNAAEEGFIATEQSSIELIGTGTSLPPSLSRVIAKRIILTGHPYKIHKRLVTVRYMFFNSEDVAWFKALQLWTKRGRAGFMKESLGTHGYFKATFDGKINPMDAVAVSMYKRVWPRSAKMWRPEDSLALHQLTDAAPNEEMKDVEA